MQEAGAGSATVPIMVLDDSEPTPRVTRSNLHRVIELEP